MNLLEVSLLEGAIRATVFALAGILVYLIMRRWSPAAGSLTAASTLVVMGVVSLLALSPWPRWAPRFSIERLHVPMVEAMANREIAAPRESNDSPGASPSGAAGRTGPRSGDETTSVYGLFDTLVRAWNTPVPPADSSGWTWREWASLFFMAAMAIGTVRLLAGLWAMRRIRSRSRPVADQDLLDTLEILRAEMSCVRPVELRTSAELATAATIGWRRPLILLPDDWHTWDEDERRAVLAHELAHVCRGDFLTGLARPAQPGPAVLSSPGALALGPAAARAGAGRRRLDGQAVRGQSPVPHDARPDGPPPRRACAGLAGPRLSPVPWYFCQEDRDASRFQASSTRPALVRHAVPDRGFPRDLLACSRPACAGRSDPRRSRRRRRRRTRPRPPLPDRPRASSTSRSCRPRPG